MADVLHLEWHNYRNTLTSTFKTLRDKDEFVDVTLTTEGANLKAHRVVLSACSPYFRDLLKGISSWQHPVLFLKDISLRDLNHILEFIYLGEVRVSQGQLPSFLHTADLLRIKGLSEGGVGVHYSQYFNQLRHHRQIPQANDGGQRPMPTLLPQPPQPNQQQAESVNSRLQHQVKSGHSSNGSTRQLGHQMGLPSLHSSLNSAPRTAGPANSVSVGAGGAASNMTASGSVSKVVRKRRSGGPVGDNGVGESEGNSNSSKEKRNGAGGELSDLPGGIILKEEPIDPGVQPVNTSQLAGGGLFFDSPIISGGGHLDQDTNLTCKVCRAILSNNNALYYHMNYVHSTGVGPLDIIRRMEAGTGAVAADIVVKEEKE